MMPHNMVTSVVGILTVIIVSAIISVLFVGQFIPGPKVWLVRRLLKLHLLVSPFNPPDTWENVAVAADIIYGENVFENSLLDFYYPNRCQGTLPIILWLHGGGHVMGDKKITKAFGMALANAGYVVANINYPLAPESKYPVPVVQVNEALAFIIKHAGQYGGDVNRLFIGGDSAGAQIAGQIAAIICNDRFTRQVAIIPAVSAKQLKGIILFCGIYNMRTVRTTRFPFLETFLWSYTGVRHFESYSRIDELSTVLHITENYPPAFLSVGDADRTEPQTLEFAAALRQKGVEVESVMFTGTNARLGHDYQYNFDTSPARKTFASLITFLRTHSLAKGSCSSAPYPGSNDFDQKKRKVN